MNINNFRGKRILVTGGCQGIGRGIALELWRNGATVVALSNQEENLKKLKAEYRSIETVTVDLTDWAKAREVIEELGDFDGLVNCAGICITEPFLECSPRSFDITVSLNVKSILNVSQIVANKMITKKIKGSIVNISSQASMAALANHTAYCASKAAVDAMTRVMALELGAHGIRVNSVNPTVIMTELGRQAWADPVKASAMKTRIPLGRFGEVQEAVNAVVFLLSERATLVSGVALPVDGGFLAT